MATPKQFTRRGKFGKFIIGRVLYFRSPSSDHKRIYHYKQLIRKNGRTSMTVQITRMKYELAKKRKKASSN